jgi:hypothetical protein
MTLLSHWLSKNYFKPNNKIKDDFYEKIIVVK